MGVESKGERDGGGSEKALSPFSLLHEKRDDFTTGDTWQKRHEKFPSAASASASAE